MELTDLQRVKKLCKWLIFADYGEKESDLATLLGYNVSSFSQFLNGKKPLTEKFINKISSVDKNVNILYIRQGGELFNNPEKLIEMESENTYDSEPDELSTITLIKLYQEKIKFLEKNGSIEKRLKKLEQFMELLRFKFEIDLELEKINEDKSVHKQ
jgi:hypothetical protein